MKFALTSVIALALAAVAPVMSNPALTAPVASTVGYGGKSLKLKWSDNGASPKTSTWGGINIYLAAGGENTQYKLQQLASNLSDSKTSGSYIVDASIGPSGSYYFIRMESTNLNSSTKTPYMAFSARFDLKNMKGTFNSTVMAAATSAEGSSSSSSSSTASSSSKGSSTASTAGSSATGTSSTSSSTSAKSSSTSSTSGAEKVSQVKGLFAASAVLAAAGVVVLL